jgi:hypothetical protein
LDLSLQDTGHDGFDLLPELLDKGLKLSFSKVGYLLDDQVAHKGDIKCALIRLKLKLSNTDEPKSELYSNAIIKTQGGYEIPLGKLLVKQSDVRKIYADYGEKEYPWAQTEKEWGWFSTQSKEVIAGSLEAETLEEAGAPALEPREGGYWRLFDQKNGLSCDHLETLGIRGL